MQKRVSNIIPPITGHIDRTDIMDRGVRYIGRDSNGADVSVDVYGSRMDVNVGGRTILVEGDYLKYDDSDRKYIICDRKGRVFLNFKVKDDGTFTVKYGREG
ncbi:MAG TPA: hypothetical protein VMC84_13195 [Methanocella sp.]|uniref:hypothetical protein n=1 Tax=Methanocella sp. TaxID=2052833 RepID=UPI002B8BF480|nr:hypothetical protein [Methanocella sp.]HTY92125.1 hypothetical protein [Methanocella sp.]